MSMYKYYFAPKMLLHVNGGDSEAFGRKIWQSLWKEMNFMNMIGNFYCWNVIFIWVDNLKLNQKRCRFRFEFRYEIGSVKGVYGCVQLTFQPVLSSNLRIQSVVITFVFGEKKFDPITDSLTHTQHAISHFAQQSIATFTCPSVAYKFTTYRCER